MKKNKNIKNAKSSAIFVTIVVHLLIIVLSFSFVAVRVIYKNEQQFENPTQPRPKVALKKLQVPNVKPKEQPKPKLKKVILAKPKINSVSDKIQMPEITGVRGGTGLGSRTGLGSLGFSMDLPDLFGSNRRGTGNEFVGHLYDLKQTDDGEITDIGKLVAQRQSDDWQDPYVTEAIKFYREILKRFLGGWNESVLDDYYKAPREKYAQSFIIPSINAAEAPKSFGVDKSVNPSMLLALYKGEICAPETGKYRFVGRGDDVLVVRVKKRVVLDASLNPQTDWNGDDPLNYKYEAYYDFGLVLGDWIYLREGDEVQMEVLIGEEPGGGFHCQLYIQQEDKEYPTVVEKSLIERPIFPIFKTTNLVQGVIQKMDINPKWATAEGPNFGVIR